MKKSFLVLAVLALLPLNVSAFEYMAPTNEATRNFSTIMQHQFEKQETLDFVNNPEEYKVKREKKDAYLDYKEGKTNELPASLRPQINVNSTRPSTTNMEFTKGEDGQIKIRGIK